MPIRVQSGLPVKKLLEEENIFVMDENSEMPQGVHPLQIAILNIMPLKEEAEHHIMRCLSNTPIPVDITLVRVMSHEARHTDVNHLEKFYVTFEDIKERNFDGFIITGAPIEQLPFEEVDYWEELKVIMEWAGTHVKSTLYLCWAAQVGLSCLYGIEREMLDEKTFGVFKHNVFNRKEPLVRGFDDVFFVPHSRWAKIPAEKLREDERLMILAESEEAGVFLAMSKEGKEIFVFGHPEYDRVTLEKEYKGNKANGVPYAFPEHYYENDDDTKKPLLTWRANGNHMYSNWLNYYVSKGTQYDLGYHLEKGI